MGVRFHVRTLALAVAVWAGFFIAGLPDYYQQYPFVAMLIFTVALVPPVVLLAVKVIGRARTETRRSLAMWLAFYFTVPLAGLDYAYCGLYLGHGLAFLLRYWYLTVYYIVPWAILAPVAWRLTSGKVAESAGLVTEQALQPDKTRVR